MDKKNIISSIVVSVVVVALGLSFFGGSTTIVERIVGASAGPDKTERHYFRNGFQGSSVATRLATTTDFATFTLTSKELGGNVEQIEWNAGLNITLTLPASTTDATYAGVFANGTTKRVYDIYSSTSTAATTITFAAGTGVDLQEDEGGTVIINGLEVARLTLIKGANTDIRAWLEVGQVAD